MEFKLDDVRITNEEEMRKLVEQINTDIEFSNAFQNSNNREKLLDMQRVLYLYRRLGVVNEAVAHPREILKTSILSNAANMIIVHNHPSGCLEPSKADTAMTDRMVKICEFIGIPLLDHIIVGGDNSHYFSFKEKKLMPVPQIYLQTDYRSLDIQTSMVAEKGRGR